MTDLARFHYIPIIRTRDAEMRGFEHLHKSIFDKILPVVEFTKSRRSKNNPDATISRCIERFQEAFPERPYIADLTSLSSLQNAEIERLLDPEDGFNNWCQFVASSLSKQTIPVVHLTSPLDEDELRLQAGRLAATFEHLALRVTPDYEGAVQAIDIVTDYVDPDKFILIVDSGFIRSREVSQVKDKTIALVDSVPYEVGLCASTSSGFPLSVTLPGYGRDDTGEFALPEIELFAALTKSGNAQKFTHSDYALIHPNDYEGVVTNWVPRVDVPLDRSLYYYRYRQPAGGYHHAARDALSDSRYAPLSCWADEAIKAAAGGDLSGRKAPAFWISVRLNYHITRQALRLSHGAR